MTDTPVLRWLILAVLVGALAVSGFHRAQARVDGEIVPRSREGPYFLALRGLMALALFGAIVMHVFKPGSMGWASFEVPQVLRWLALLVAALTIPAVHWVLRTLGRNVTETVLTKKSHELVTAGPYRWVRHPLYTTGLTLLLALGIAAGSWFILLVVILVAVLIRLLVIPREEQALLAKFGAEYSTYMQRAGRLVPRFMRTV